MPPPGSDAVAGQLQDQGRDQGRRRDGRERRGHALQIDLAADKGEQAEGYGRFDKVAPARQGRRVVLRFAVAPAGGAEPGDGRGCPPDAEGAEGGGPCPGPAGKGRSAGGRCGPGREGQGHLRLVETQPVGQQQAEQVDNAPAPQDVTEKMGALHHPGEAHQAAVGQPRAQPEACRPAPGRAQQKPGRGKIKRHRGVAAGERSSFRAVERWSGERHKGPGAAEIDHVHRPGTVPVGFQNAVDEQAGAEQIDQEEEEGGPAVAPQSGPDKSCGQTEESAGGKEQGGPLAVPVQRSPRQAVAGNKAVALQVEEPGRFPVEISESNERGRGDKNQAGERCLRFHVHGGRPRWCG